ncbi:CHAP domain-containing protein [Siphonobacter sp. SORGH_AS_0500]|uniref:CHAP domain-containing protein n=1 Tax=Siphonobacter sp. SORGH_AS_0500 TaxID=1864824 RepID=UPI00285D9085|nr:CHAP domain-containing protein [Siphonobacter sp. SORGH_AS_0500]MDR6194714.1 hypothetical protein [Siphonobacter sp. SORGH_AS_0500]
MATYRLLFLLGSLACLGFHYADAGNLRIDPDSARAKVVKTAKSLLYVKEKHNHNDHPMITEMFDKIGYPGMKKASWTSRMWCMAYVTYCFTENGIKTGIPGPAAVRNWKAAKSKRVPTGKAIKPADVAIFTWGSHGGLVVEAHPNPGFPFVYTYEGNTGAPRGELNQNQGVWPKTRLRREILCFIRIIN